MNTTNPTTPHASARLPREPSSVLRLPTRWVRTRVLRQLADLRRGSIHVTDDLGRVEIRGEQDGPSAAVAVRSDAFYRALALHGTLGAAESYIRGEWSTADLTSVMRLLLVNRDAWDDLEPSGTSLRTPITRALHVLRRNTLRGSRRNIVAHYDLGREFFELFLDPTLSYSCGIFESPTATMEEASMAKIDRACRKLALAPETRLLEIGSGWGAFAIHAAREYGCRVVTTTLSDDQYDVARRRVHEAGLNDRVEVLRRDYRALEGEFDRVVSIEMIEAVGAEFFGSFFRCVDERLTTDGLALLQAITIQDQAYERARDSVDFIKRYIFPGSCLPSVSALVESATRASSMKLTHLEDLTPHYAETLRRWRYAFEANRAAIRSLGFSEEFIRMWEFYLCYCEAGFEERYVGDVQMLLAKPGARNTPLLPPLARP